MPHRIRKLAPADLKDAALNYLGRYAASTARLRQVMTRRINRSARANELDPQPLMAELERVVAMLHRTGLLNDEAFAEGRARSLNRRGGSRRQIAAKLSAAGVAQATTAQALAGLEDELPDAEFTAALAYAKRRRLGAFRAVLDESPERRRKDLMAMARAGFALDLARRALAGEEDS
ncbi:regulatory protein RecX [Dongia sp.]|uniref:regulatory protein RecX n=1 Tax=Dongia sp. TaxID=1977262 RepID=UPI0037500AC1